MGILKNLFKKKSPKSENKNLEAKNDEIIKKCESRLKQLGKGEC